MSEELTTVLRIEGQDTASAMLRSVVDTLKAIERQADKTARALQKNFGTEMLKPLAKVREESKAFGSDLAEAAERAAKAIRSDVQAVTELRSALRGAVADEKALGTAMLASRAAGAAAVRRQTTAARNAATGRARAEQDDFRQWRAKWRRRQASERADATDLRRRLSAGRYLMNVRQRSERLARREADRIAKAEAAATARRERTETADLNRRVRAMRYLSGVRERSERAELAGIARIRRERDAMRRHAASAGRHAYGHARHALRSVNHPAFASIGHATALGAAFGAGAAAKILESSIGIDSAAARYRMFAVPDGVDATKDTAEAVRAAKLDSIKFGMEASTLLDVQAKAVRDGISPAIAKTLPASIAAAAKVMGGDPERLTDTLSEGIQQGLSMGLMKDAGDVRRFLNLEAGLSNYAGNSSEKMEQFVAAGGIGRGKELGLNLTDTMAYGALLNSSGMRTGQATSRFLGQLSQSVPKMFDRYRQAAESHRNTEQDRAVRSAPGALGYGSVREMQARILAGPEGLIEFSTRLNKLNEKQRKLILEGYGFSEQGGAALAEIGASPEKANGVLARAKELALQAQANDYLVQKFADWQTSLANMLQQIEAGWRAVESEVGDVLKNDIVAPIRDWWVKVSAAILGSDMKADAHRAIVSFINGLGFADMRAALDSLSGSVNGETIAGFAKGIGEGLRSVYDSVAELASMFGGGSGLDAEAVGKFASELFGLSVALHVLAPFVTLIGGIASAFLAVKAAVEGAATVARLTGVADGLKGILALDLAGGAAGLLSLTGGIAALLGLAKLANDKGVMQPPKSWDMRGFLDFLDPNLGNMVLGKPGAPAASAPSKPAKAPTSTLPPSEYWARKNRYLHPSSLDGGDGQSWRDLLTPASYSPSDSGDVVRGAVVDTAHGIVDVREAVDRLGAILRTASLTGSGSGGDGGSSGGAGLSNMRYGRTGSGAYRSSPGGAGAGGGSGMTAVSKDLTPESRALLDTLASGEAPAYNVLNGGGRFSDYSHHPGGRAAGRYQFLPSTWARVSKALGLKDFSPESQDRGAWWLAQQDYKSRTGRNLDADLKTKDPSRIAAVGRALHSTWVSLNGSFGGKYQHYLDRQSSGAVASNGGGGASAPGQVRGNLNIGGETFRYGSGGAGGSASIPFGDYPINPDAPGAWGRAHDAMAVNGTGSIWDKALGRMRTGIEMHAASTAAMVTHGCLGFMRDEYPRLKARVREMIAKTGHAYLHVGPNGATITPFKDGAAEVMKPAVPSGLAKRAAPFAPADIAGKVLSTGRPRRGTGDAPPGGSMSSADASTTTHHWYISGEAGRRAVLAHLPDWRSGATIDVDAFG